MCYFLLIVNDLMNCYHVVTTRAKMKRRACHALSVERLKMEKETISTGTSVCLISVVSRFSCQDQHVLAQPWPSVSHIKHPPP